MIRTYAINRRSVLDHFGYSLLLIIFGLFLTVFSMFEDRYFHLPSVWYIILGMIAIVLTLTVDYLVNSSGKAVNVFPDRIEVIAKDNSSTEIPIENICQVTINCAPSVRKNSSFRLLPFETFHFACLELSNGAKIYITSLSDHELNSSLSELEIFRNKLTFATSLFPSIWWSRIK